MAWQVFVYIQAALGGTLWTAGNNELRTTATTEELTTTTPAVYDVVDTLLSPHKLCLGLHDVFIALLLVLLILMTIFGNVLVVLSVFMYKRMRTFTNILLTSLATADLLVGLVVMPLSLLDLLHSHNWPFGRLLCSIWATTDVLLCTASILNLCVISLDRYFAITSPLKYPRTRSRKMAAGLLSAVWMLSLVVCSPPWFVPSWNLFTHDGNHKKVVNGTIIDTFACAYSTSQTYRIYSASGSFYIPLLVMLSVYFKIFRVASEREALMRQSVGTCRLSNRIVKTQAKNNRRNPRDEQIRALTAAMNGSTNRECASAPLGRNRMMQDNNGTGTRANYSVRPMTNANNRHVNIRRLDSRLDSSEADELPAGVDSCDHSQGGTGSNGVASPKTRSGDVPDNNSNHTDDRSSKGMERECHSLADLADRSVPSVTRKNTEVRQDDTNISSPLTTTRRAQTRLQPQNLMAKAHEHYQMCGPGKAGRGSKEKMVYLRERKALKTIGIVVLGFIICWMPFFVLYLLEVFIEHVRTSLTFQVLGEFFLWLGYSNSVLNPIIYTMYNGDFRRCFRDLLSFGCIQHHRRTMSVKKLHQQSTIF